LAADAELLSGEELDRINYLLKQVYAAQTSAVAADIEAAVDALAKGTEAFAALRMNRSIAQALAGKNVENL
jgi:molecular chaperone HscA